MKNLNGWKEDNEALIKKMDKWREKYHCRNNCEEWKKWKFCKHLRNARARKFGEEIEKVIGDLIILNKR